MGAPLDGVLPWVYSQGDRAQRYLNGLLSDPVGTAQQAAGNFGDKTNMLAGLLRQSYQDPKSYQPTDTNALAQLISGLQSGPMGFAPVGMAALAKPLGTAPHYATSNLSEYTPKLYRETSIDRASDFLPNSMSQPQTLWFSNDPAYALGQGANKGVMMEFNAQGVPGQLSLQKPMARQAYENGNAEFISRDAMPSQIGANLQSLRVSPEQQKGPYFRRVKGLLGDWQVNKEADGTLVYVKP